MKTENTVLYVLRLALTLFLIAAVVAAALAGVNSITKPIIEQLNAEKTQKAIEAVLPGGFDEQLTDFDNQGGLVSKVYKGANGYALEVLPSGFDNTITMMVGVDNEGKVLGISIVSHTETEAIAAAPIASVPAAIVANNTVAVDTVAGATVTSNAIIDAVVKCLEQAAE